MNQDNYFEEAFKMRNVLEEFLKAHHGQRRPTILGLRAYFHWKAMQEQLRKLKEMNKNLKREIRRRMGESLNGMTLEELCSLEQKMDESVKIIRERKMKVIGNQIETHKKKVRNGEEIHRNLLHEFELREEDPRYGLVENGGEEYDNSSVNVVGYSQEAVLLPRILAFRLQPNQPNLHSGAGGSHLTTFALLE